MNKLHWLFRLIVSSFLFFLFENIGHAQDLGEAGLELADQVREMPVSATVRLMVIVSALTFLPAMMLAMTPFTRFIIVFSMMRQAVGVQQAPPNQVLVGLSLFLSLLIMQPVLEQVNTEAIQPFMSGEIETFEALEVGMAPLRTFMLSNTRRVDLETMMKISRQQPVDSLSEIPSTVVISSFLLSELKTAFVIGVKIYLPFLVVDIIIANILLGMGMLVLPPVIISLPFKIMLFVLMDGWTLLISSMVNSFYGV